MDASVLREILKTEYGIKSEAEFLEALKECKGINIGIFVNGLEGGNEKSLQNVSNLDVAS